MHAAAEASSVAYRSFAEASSAVLDLLARQLPDAGVFLTHLDRSQDLYRIVDTRRGTDFDLRSNMTMRLTESFCLPMADDRAPRLCNDVAAHPLYGACSMQRITRAGSYLGVPLELSDGSRVGSVCCLASSPDAFQTSDLQLVAMLARVLAYELERETNERDLRRLNESLRTQARGMAAIGRVARVLATHGDARETVCEAACEVSGGTFAFLLEPVGRDFRSTAHIGIDMDPVTIAPREDDPTGVTRAFASLESLFIPDAAEHGALAPSLVEATMARSALFEPIVRDGTLAGVLIVLWTSPVEFLPESVTAALRLVAAEAAVAIEHAGLRRRVSSLALSDGLTGLVTARVWDDELPREIARARRSDAPVCVALVDVDHMAAFNEERGQVEGDRFVKEAASAWLGQLREIDLLARLDGDEFGILLPGCALSEACDVLDRVRTVTPRGRTSSAGVARWNGEEPVELLLHRARAALAAAKDAGRDMTLAAE